MNRRAPLLLSIAVVCPLLVADLTAQGAALQPAVESGTIGAESYAAPAPAEPALDLLGEPVPAAEGAVVEAGARRDATVAFGLSGALRAAVVRSSEIVPEPLVLAAGAEPESAHWVPVEGTVRRGLLGEPVSRQGVIAPDGPGVWRLNAGQGEEAGSAEGPFSFITAVPFAEKRGGYLNGYHIGFYPTEGSARSDHYAPPEAFIEVTPENQDLQISEHFTLREFLTKDQFDYWPKYVVLNLRLIDKLELVLQELNRMGVRALDLRVMSGFRTPQYNGPGGDGRAALSRHMYGDAADIWVDGDQDGYIDDLNGDGKQDIADAEVLLRAVERVEQRYPELTGGAGLYEANGYHGPFVHVDVRGTRARW